MFVFVLLNQLILMLFLARRAPFTYHQWCIMTSPTQSNEWVTHQSIPQQVCHFNTCGISGIGVCGDHFFPERQTELRQSSLGLSHDEAVIKVHPAWLSSTWSHTKPKPESKPNFETKSIFLGLTQTHSLIKPHRKQVTCHRGICECKFVFPLKLTCRVGPPLTALTCVHSVTPLLWRHR